MPVKKLLSQALVSRFLILTLDILIVLVSFLISNLLRFNFRIPADVVGTLFTTSIYVLVVRSIPFYIMGTYASVIKYTGEEDAKKILRAVSISSAIFIILHYTLPYSFKQGIFFYPISIILIDYVLSSFALVLYRVSLKLIINEISTSTYNLKSVKKRTVIFGAGKSGLLVKKVISDDKSSDYNIIAWLDDNYLIRGKSLDGIKIYHAIRDFDHVISRYQIDTIILSMQLIDPSRKQDFMDLCLERNIQMLYLPPVKSWLNGQLNVQQLQKFKIEDVLDREPIVLDNEYLKFQLNEKSVMITGAAGSIGSEIVRQISHFLPERMILVDIAESPLVDLVLEIEEKYNFKNIVSVVADVTNTERMDKIFSRYKPEIIYHAAAYKHVPMMEQTPYEAVRVNILGSKTIADLAVKHKTERFVMVSTDKAVNPTNVMGCSKRVAEIYIQSLNTHTKNQGEVTRFITTRFGNVLGSNGSVIPRFQKQIESGGPITVTDERITRFFMTIPEACQLVLEAGVMGKGGEIFIFDMGKPVKIIDLAEKMIKLSGMLPYKDINIVFSGLRPGEKLEEELLSKKENIIATHHHKIMKAMVREYSFPEVRNEVDLLVSMLSNHDDNEIVAKMKKIVPEYVSNNSIFEKLDVANFTNVNKPN